MILVVMFCILTMSGHYLICDILVLQGVIIEEAR